MHVRDAGIDDMPQICELFNALIPTTTVAWLDDLETLPQRLAWFAERQAAGEPVLVAEEGSTVVGYCTYGDFREAGRWTGYRHTKEHSIHLAGPHQGAGIGRALLEALIDHAVRDGVHVLVAAIDADNAGSIRFHQRLGFTTVAVMPQTGRKFDRWLDLVLMQRIL